MKNQRNIRLFRKFALLAAVCIVPMQAPAEVVNDAVMRAEADTFLARMPRDLQHRQAQAIIQAIAGDNKHLEEVRHSRNSEPLISENVRVIMLTPTLRLYEAKDAEQEQLPLLIYFHGGGWTFGSLNSCARYCDAIASRGLVKVLAVDYRLAPEHPFPAGLIDCVAAVRYANSHACELGIDASRISLGGDSSGGNLALATALTESCKGLVHSLVLFYPVTKAFADKSESWLKYGDGFGLDAELMEVFNDAYCINADATDCSVSPGLCSDDQLASLPPTLMVAAGRDILRDQGCELASRMPERIHRVEFAKAVHLFITVPGQDTTFSMAVELSHHFLTDN